jgi:diketogulonate reductase-like aldo/keto reductase
MNNLRLAIESAGDDLSWLPADSVRDVHGFVTQLGSDAGMWYGNWANAAPIARQLFEQLRQYCEETPTPLQLPPSNIGTRFPIFGRSVAVPTDGDKSHSVTLGNGFAMPVLGFGTWQLANDGTTYQTVRWALQLGYRHIDTAQGYANEQEVGRAIKDSGVPRSEICLVTKLSDAREFRSARRRFEEQLALLGVEYVDIYMLHQPGDAEGRKQAWQQLEELYDEGKIKALGLSNFNIPLIEDLLSYARIRPVYLQNKYSIYQPGGRDEAESGESLMQWLAREQIVMTGYSIIHPEHGGYMSPLEDPHVKAIADRHKRTPSQILHRWLLQLGAAVIPRSTKYDRIRENGDLFTFALPETDMRLLNGIVSLFKSTPGSKSPTWSDDVYGLQAFA